MNGTGSALIADRMETSSEMDCSLAAYSPSERKAILYHRFFLSIELGKVWRRTKTQRDGIAQLKEIERHKYYLSMQSGRDIGWDVAIFDWIRNHAAAWREWWEQHWWEKQWWEEEKA